MSCLRRKKQKKLTRFYQQIQRRKKIDKCKKNGKIALTFGIGVLAALKIVAMTGVFMPKNSNEYQDLRVKEIKNKGHKRVKHVLINAHDGLQLHATIFEAKKPVGLVQIIHGAMEHKARYYPLMKFLARNGYTCIISDNRGHGYSINKDYPLGYMNGVDQIMDDQHRVTRYIKKEYPDLELSLIGHSLGSIFARDYLQNFDYEINKLVLSGTPYFHEFTRVGIYWGRALLFYLGSKRSSRIFNNISNEKSWLSNNKDNIKKAEEDPLMFGRYSNAAGYTIWEANWNLKQYRKFKCQNPSLEIMNMVGEEDVSITGGRRGIQDTLHTLEKIGYEHIENKVYTNMKHEIFNENNKMLVYQDVLDFLNK